MSGADQDLGDIARGDTGQADSDLGVTVVNLSVLKNDRAKAIRFSTLVALCRELDCQPGDLLTVGEPA